MSEQLDLFNTVFEGLYVTEQIFGSSGRDRPSRLIGIAEVDNWARKKGLESFVIKYSDYFWVKRTLNSRGGYTRSEHKCEP